MVSIPFGLSIHHFISSVGADVGFASLIGLALLVLLYFAQARESATLRARADEASQRLLELEGDVAHLTAQVAALPAEISVRATSPRAAAAYGGGQERAPVGARAGAFPPAAPAGVAAPALAAATRLIPDPASSLGLHEPAPAGVYREPADSVAPMGGHAPATAAGGSNGSAHRPVGAPAAAAIPAAAAASAATAQRVVQAPAGAPPRPAGGPPRGVGAAQGRPGGGQPRPAGQPRPGAGQGRPGGPTRPSMPVRPGPRRSRRGRVLALLIAALAVAVVAVAVVVLTSGNNSSSTASKPPAASAALASHRTSPTNAVKPSSVTVSVLNGTTTLGLAGRVSQRLLADGYRKGFIGNTTDQTSTSTLVQYMPNDVRDALAVAAALKLGQASVKPIDQTTQQIACPPSSACTSAVVVTVGHDLAAQ